MERDERILWYRKMLSEERDKRIQHLEQRLWLAQKQVDIEVLQSFSHTHPRYGASLRYVQRLIGTPEFPDQELLDEVWKYAVKPVPRRRRPARFRLDRFFGLYTLYPEALQWPEHLPVVLSVLPDYVPRDF